MLEEIPHILDVTLTMQIFLFGLTVCWLTIQNSTKKQEDDNSHSMEQMHIHDEQYHHNALTVVVDDGDSSIGDDFNILV